MTFYNLKQRIEGRGPVSPAVAAYLERAKERLPREGVYYNPEWTPEGHPREHWRWVENISRGLRSLGPVHDLHKRHDDIGPRLIDHNGWYTDEDGFGDTVHGLVLQLPAREGKPLYLSAINDPNNDDCGIVDFHSATDDLREAARTADDMANWYAENEREYRAKERAENRIEEIDTEVSELRAGVLTLARELRANCDKLTGLTAIRAALRERIKSVRAECAKLARERKRIVESGLIA